mmetsp:Transcript_14758/g.25108  ORF Transcript_14758/g.25108 Transcript_14758/m.25108 type:complete len:118 (+) Transcript_14758:1009-1362(+)
MTEQDKEYWRSVQTKVLCEYAQFNLDYLYDDFLASHSAAIDLAISNLGGLRSSNLKQSSNSFNEQASTRGKEKNQFASLGIKNLHQILNEQIGQLATQKAASGQNDEQAGSNTVRSL